MRTLLKLVLLLMLIPVGSEAGINCFAYPGGVLSCDGDNGNTTIQQFSPTQGVITQSGRGNNAMTPYTITPAPAPSRDLNRTIEPLGLLPSTLYQNTIPAYDTTPNRSEQGFDPYGNGSVK